MQMAPPCRGQRHAEGTPCRGPRHAEGTPASGVRFYRQPVAKLSNFVYIFGLADVGEVEDVLKSTSMARDLPACSSCLLTKLFNGTHAAYTCASMVFATNIENYEVCGGLEVCFVIERLMQERHPGST